MDSSVSNSTDHLNAIFSRQRDAFSLTTVPDMDARRDRLKRFEKLIAARQEAIVSVISADFGTRSAMESRVAEIAFAQFASRHLRKNLKKWAGWQRVSNSSPIPGKARIQRQPKGVAGVISPWNYPFQLAIVPVLTAFAAGNRVMLKPSELTPATSAFLKSLFAEEFDQTEVAVITGGPDIGEAFSNLPFDHLFYTGSTRIGRLVAMAAAKNLTPVTLELGGKSPGIVLPDADLERTARAISYGKFMNAGQTCVAPDYLLVPRDTGREWADAILAETAAAWPDLAGNGDYSSIISGQHRDRLTGMIDAARNSGATVLETPGDTATLQAAGKLAPTIVLDPPLDSDLMREEIFGPVLPIIEVGSTQEAVDFVTARDHPLALYVFGRSSDEARSVLEKTTSGGACINGANVHLAIDDLPFGGVGKSGYGAYHGERGFREFSHERAVFDLPTWLPLGLMMPPYSGLFRKFTGWQIRR